MHLLAQPAFRADGKGIADEQHADHQLRIDRRTAARGIIRGQRPADRAQIQHRINLAEQVVRGDVPIEAELIKKLRRFVLSTHHRTISRSSKTETRE